MTQMTQMPQINHTDDFGQEIAYGDYIIYGDSSKYAGVTRGIITSITELRVGINNSSATMNPANCFVVTDQIKKNNPEFYAKELARYQNKIDADKVKNKKVKVTHRYVVSVIVTEGKGHLVIQHKLGTRKYNGLAASKVLTTKDWDNFAPITKRFSGKDAEYRLGHPDGKNIQLTTRDMDNLGLEIPTEGTVIEIPISPNDLKAFLEDNSIPEPKGHSHKFIQKFLAKLK